MKKILKKITPEPLKKKYHAYNQKKLKAKVASLPRISEQQFRNIVCDKLLIGKGDIVFVHSSIDQLNLDFPFYNALNILLDIVGEDGTLLFPTFPKLTSYKFLKQGEIFKQKRTPSYMGILSEFARRHSKAKRSLHPTKSVVAIGNDATELTTGHELSPRPYDKNSPFYKAYIHNGKAIGIGVKTTYFSAVHVIDDIVPDKIPINPYHDKLLTGHCIDQNKNEIDIETYAHDMNKMMFDLPKFFKKNIKAELCEDLNIDGMNFFRADMKKCFDKMFELADEGITIYKY